MNIPINLITLYADLIQDLHLRSERPASLYQREIKGISYTYAKRQAGTVRRDIFIGRTDAPDTLKRIKVIETENQRAADRRKTIAALKAGGIPAPASDLGLVLDALDDAGLLKATVLVGTSAYLSYPAFVGTLLPQASLSTEDADIATMSLALKADVEEDSFETVLKRADPTYAGMPGLNPKAYPSRFRAKSGFTVDLLTPVLRRDDPNPIAIQGLQAAAATLQFLRWLIQDPIQAASLFGSGQPIFIPQPARYAVHKLIVAQRRTGNVVKRSKDLAQAKALIDALKRRDPFALEDARDAAFAEGESWETPIRRSLSELKLTADFEPGMA
ncbi:MAG: GSU2403 family nucleotidyltransferase fold protein [Rhizobiaceae bacterium]|nr:GSU2403 family nucleotidyltransferase fold protein [Rhizobiaceae bacterium]